MTVDLKQEFEKRIPPGDDRTRNVCTHCGYVEYANPKIVAGAVVHRDGKILLCKRAIEPRKGFWTLPAGYMENLEDVETAARREAHEEANADIELEGVLGIYSVPRISQVQILFRAALLNEPSAGPESEAVGLFAWDEIPWDELAFPTVYWALRQYDETKGDKVLTPEFRTALDSERPEGV
jgi:ADP-ribose pyrophosphatase YjhB (NUDIX family)